ncbi:MAG: phytanoyl-CoA dioxygenase family protein [Myxococcales bacterium]|nr:phytanoyl-CoA dioxygenase family protein [Myxococcales bacterium]
MPLVHLPADAPTDEITDVLDRDGCVVLDRVLDRETISQVRSDMAPYIETAPRGDDEFTSPETRSAGMIVARSPKAREIIMNSTILEIAAHALSHATTFQLHIAEVIDVGPGAAAQPVHRDQWAFDLFPFPVGHDSTCATMWALTDFTEENGATRVIPGSHTLENNLEFSQADTEPAVMEAGSVLLYTGSLYHGAGANRSDSPRPGLIVHYSLGWLRQEENQYLSVPSDVLQSLPEDLLRLMGYSFGAYSLGFIDGGRDPIAAIRPDLEKSSSGISYQDVRERLSPA